MFARAQRDSWKLAQVFGEYPFQIHDVLEQARDGQIEVGFVHKGLDDFMHTVDVAFNALDRARGRGRAHRVEPDRRLRDRGPQFLGLHVVSVFGFLFAGLLGVSR